MPLCRVPSMAVLRWNGPRTAVCYCVVGLGQLCVIVKGALDSYVTM